MEGLIPFVIHAFKKKKERSKYRSLSTGSIRRGGSCRMAPPVLEMSQQDGSSHHRRTQSEFQPPEAADCYFYADSESQIGPSRSLHHSKP